MKLKSMLQLGFLTAAPLITEIPAVIELVTHPILRNASAAGASEVTAATG